MCGKECIGPALMIPTSAMATSAHASSENTAQSHSYPSVKAGERGPVAVFEVFKPASRGSVDVSDDRFQAIAVATLRFGPYRIFEFPAALLAWPAIASLEVITEKVKSATLCGIYDVGLFGV